ncbi:MAG: BREX system Lon protease-like protein BrxL [Waddliaceae bacterium]
MSWQDKLKEHFPDKVIEKHLMSNLARRTIPRFVSEYLLAKYAQRGQDEAIRVANQIMRDYYPEMRHSQRVLFELSTSGTKRILGFFTARFDTKLNIPLISTRLFGKEEMRILPKILDTYPILLEGGAWGVADLVYDSGVTVEGRKLPILITNFAPFQVDRIDLEDYKEQRKHFSTDEWVSVLISTIGLNPSAYDMDEKLLILTRFIPLVEPNTNLLELGPRGTGKTFGLRNISPYSFIISGGKTTSAQLFLNLRTMEVGLLAKKDVVVFDEIAATKFEKRDDVLGKLKDFMASGSFSRGSEEIPSECAIVMLGNTDHAVPEDEKIDEEMEEALADDTLPSEWSEPVDDASGKVGTRYLFQALPDPLWDTAFFDRLHGFIPGWRIPKIKTMSFSKDVGFVADYFAEILHRLRRDDYTHLVRSKVNVYTKDGEGITSRDEEAVLRVICGLVKLLYPHGGFTDDELAILSQIACSLRTRVAQQQHHIEMLTSGSAREFPLKTLRYELR